MVSLNTPPPLPSTHDLSTGQPRRNHHHTVTEFAFPVVPAGVAR